MENIHTKQMQHMIGLIKKQCSHKMCDGSGAVEEQTAQELEEMLDDVRPPIGSPDNIISVACLCQSDNDDEDK